MNFSHRGEGAQQIGEILCRDDSPGSEPDKLFGNFKFRSSLRAAKRVCGELGEIDGVRQNHALGGWDRFQTDVPFCSGRADRYTATTKSIREPVGEHTRPATLVNRSEERRVGKECRS